MMVDMHRSSAYSIDDAHNLNQLIVKNTSKFSPEFVQGWHLAYGQWCKEREPIKLLQGEDS